MEAMETSDTVKESTESNGSCFSYMHFCKVNHTAQLCIGKFQQLIMTHFMIVHANQFHKCIMWCVFQSICYCRTMNLMPPWIYMGSLSNNIKVIANQNRMLSCDKVMPLPCLAT